MQNVRYTKTPAVEKICEAIIPIVAKHTGAPAGLQSTICPRYIPDVCEELQSLYGVRISVEDVLGKATSELAQMIRWQLCEKLQCDVITVISDVTYIDQIDLRPNVLIEKLDLDSLTMVDVAVKLDQEFNVLITERELSGIRTIAGVITLISSRLPEER